MMFGARFIHRRYVDGRQPGRHDWVFVLKRVKLVMAVVLLKNALLLLSFLRQQLLLAARPAAPDPTRFTAFSATCTCLLYTSPSPRDRG